MIGGGIQKVSKRRESLKFMRPLLSGELREELKGPERSLDSSLKKTESGRNRPLGSLCPTFRVFLVGNTVHSSKGAFFHSTI